MQKVLNILSLFSKTLAIKDAGEPPTLDDLLEEQPP